MPSIREGQRWKRVTGLVLLVGGLLWFAWRWLEVRWYREAMAEIQQDMEKGLNAVAARKLEGVRGWRPDSDEAAYLLGICEQALGRPEAADRAWAQVAPGSSFATRAILGRLELEVERGQLSEAETLIKTAMDDPRIDATGLPLFLGPALCLQGRVGEALRSLETRWEHLEREGRGASEEAINLVRLHGEIRRNPPTVESVRTFLEQAAMSAPEDDRVWLGRARLATREGSYQEAARWLDACLRRRPRDAAVWRARLNWAVATGQVSEARKAEKQLPTGALSAAEDARLEAWFASQRGDFASEQRTLERLVAMEPADLDAIDRLAEIERQAGRSERASAWNHRRTEIARRQERFEKLQDRNQPLRDAVELARVAEQLGYGFEARGFLTLAVALHPERAELRGEVGRLKRRAGTLAPPERVSATRTGRDGASIREGSNEKVILADLVEEESTADAEGLGRPSPVATAGGEGATDRATLDISEHGAERKQAIGTGRGGLGVLILDAEVLGEDRTSAGRDRGAGQDVLELTHVAAPFATLDLGEGLGSE